MMFRMRQRQNQKMNKMRPDAKADSGIIYNIQMIYEKRNGPYGLWETEPKRS